MSDIDDLADYYYDCLVRKGIDASKSASKVNMEFWLRFGSVYYLEKDDEIKIVATVVPTDITHHDASCVDSQPKWCLTVNVFSKYNNENAFSLAQHVRDYIVTTVVEEQHLTYCPVRIGFLPNDPFRYRTMPGSQIMREPGNVMESLYYKVCDNVEQTQADKDRTNAFFNKFSDAWNEYTQWRDNVADPKIVDWMSTQLRAESYCQHYDEPVCYVCEWHHQNIYSPLETMRQYESRVAELNEETIEEIAEKLGLTPDMYISDVSIEITSYLRKMLLTTRSV